LRRVQQRSAVIGKWAWQRRKLATDALDIVLVVGRMRWIINRYPWWRRRYVFRLRLHVNEHRLLGSPDKEMRLSIAEDVRLCAGGGAAINKSTKLLVIGRGYRSEALAKQAARRWRAILERSFARASIGADFGDRGAGDGGISDWLREQIEPKIGRPILNELSLMVFPELPWPRFVGVPPISMTVATSADVVAATIEIAEQQSDLSVSEEETLAYDLFSGSFSQSGPDSRYMLLMMAVEALLAPDDRAPAAIAHVDRLIQETKEADLPDDEIGSMIGTLRWLKQESIRRTGKKLAQQLGDRRYMDGSESAVEFFVECYDLRNRIAHGRVPRPPRDEVERRALQLERFVSDLLSGELRDLVDFDAILARRGG
jgi:hypothetical protein